MISFMRLAIIIHGIAVVSSTYPFTAASSALSVAKMFTLLFFLLRNLIYLTKTRQYKNCKVFSSLTVSPSLMRSCAIPRCSQVCARDLLLTCIQHLQRLIKGSLTYHLLNSNLLKPQSLLLLALLWVPVRIICNGIQQKVTLGSSPGYCQNRQAEVLGVHSNI